MFGDRAAWWVFSSKFNKFIKAERLRLLRRKFLGGAISLVRPTGEEPKRDTKERLRTYSHCNLDTVGSELCQPRIRSLRIALTASLLMRKPVVLRPGLTSPRQRSRSSSDGFCNSRRKFLAPETEKRIVGPYQEPPTRTFSRCSRRCAEYRPDSST